MKVLEFFKKVIKQARRIHQTNVLDDRAAVSHAKARENLCSKKRRT